jgi:hypothetical protein
MIIGEILRATVNYSMPGASAVQNVFYWELGEAPISDTQAAGFVADWLELEWGARWAVMASTDVQLVDADLLILNSSGVTVRNLGTASVNVFGEVTEDEETVASAYFMQADTSVPRTKGRKYVPGVPEGQVVDGLIVAGQLVNLALLLAEYVGVIPAGITAILTPGVISRTAEVFRPFLSAGSVTDIPAYQRRRKPNVGA